MDALKRFTALPAPQMASIVIAVLAVLGFLVGAWTWLQTPDYRVLFSNLGDKDGGAVVAALTTMNVPYKFNEGGGSITVPSTMVSELRYKLAAQGLPKGGTPGYDLLDQQKFGTTQLQEQMNFQRGLEGELAKSIQTIAAVQSARVHLAIPKPTIFLREHQKPTASVVLSLYPGKTLDGAQVQGIVHLVASSVPELADPGVSVVDGSGNLLSRTPEINGLEPGKLAYVRQQEQDYANRITGLIEKMVGPGNVRAEVTADMDFSQTERTAETFAPNGTPDKSAMRSQQTADASSTNGAPAPVGVPGAQANTPTNAAAPATLANAPGASTAATQSTSTKKDSTVNYELDRTVETKRLAVGTVRRLSAAIVVNHRTVAAKTGQAEPKKDASADAVKATTSEPLTKEEIEQITALARQAIGFDEKRGDSINVVNTPFTQADLVGAIDVPMWKSPDNIALAKDVGKNVGFALLAAYLLFGVLRPAVRRMTTPLIAVDEAPPTATPLLGTDGEPAAATPQLAYPEHLQRARQLARDDPKALAGLVRNWVAAE